MVQPIDIGGNVFKNASATFLARVLDANGNPLAPSSINSASVTVTALDSSNPNNETAITGFTAVTLTPSAILFASLQIGGLWDADSIGYNFAHTLDVSSGQAFATAGLFYRVLYLLNPISGQPIPLRFRVKAV